MLEQQPLRFRMSALGARRCPRQASGTGVVISRGKGMRHIGAVRVRFDGSKSPVTLHHSYVEIEEVGQGAAEPVVVDRLASSK